MGSRMEKPGVVTDATEWVSGMRAKGEFRCSDCGYGITVYRALPDCPMCRGTEWVRVDWRPSSRVRVSTLIDAG